jgi:two-component system chemotaxis response regulator CheB
MAENALQHVEADYSVPAAELGPLLSTLARHPSAKIQYDAGISELTEVENEYAKLNEVPRNRLDAIGRPSSLMCPLCNGLLWQLKEGPRRFRCHSGHAFAPGALMVEHRELTEQTLAVLMILLDDEVTLSRHVFETSTDPEQRRVIAQDLRSSEMRAAALRELLPGGVRRSKKVRPSVS